MKQAIKLMEKEEKTSKAGNKYNSYKTGDGQMSCFEDDVVEQLNKNIGKNVEVEVERRGNFKNITKFYDCLDEDAPKGNSKDTTPNYQQTVSSEARFRINIGQLASGKAKWEVTARGQTKEEVAMNLKDALHIAQGHCNDINEMNSTGNEGVKE